MTYTRASDDYSNAKTLEATYGIELDQAGTNDFGEDTYGYANAPTELTVTVSNVDDNNATGDLTVALSGDNAGSFTLSKASINSIAVGADDSFTVEPNGNLPAGTHTATVTVENDNVSESFDVSFTVNPKDITVTNFSIDTKIYDGTDAAEVAAVTFGGLEYGDNLTIDVDYTVSATFNDFNAGTGKTVTATVTLTTTDAAKNYNLTNGEDYPLTSQAISVKALTIDNFTIATKVYDGTTNAEVTGVTFGGLENDEILTVDVDYTVSAAFEDASLGTGKKVTATVTMQSTDKANNYNLAVATKELTGQSIVLLYYGVELDRTGMQTFTTAPYGYTQPELDVEVSNTGNDVTGDLTVDLSGADAGSFTLSETSITSIEVSEAGSFTVAPQPGLSVGTYTATVTVSSSAHSISETFDVEFTVTQKAITVTPDAKSKLYGQSDPALTYTCAPALVAGDEFTGTLSRAAGENLGTYLIGQNTLALSSNYQLTFTTGVLFTINPTNPRLLQDLEDAIICAGESYTFKIVAEGDNLSYEWYHGNERINGVNGNTYTITNAESGNSGRYYVIVRSDLGSYRSSVYSKEVNLWVTGQLPETLRFTEFPSTAVTGQTYRIKLAGYSDVTQYLWSYDRDGVTFSPVTGGVGNNETLATFGSLSVGQGLLTVTLEHPCGTRQATQAILVQYPTGVEQVAEQAVRVFPNPTAGIIKVSGTKSSQIIRVVDMTGSLKGTYPARDGETTIDLSGYAQGTYLIQYNGKTIKAVRK
ncbi:MAG: YDG domain-containing protein [Dysgonamonadaceae bacterium]|nr:YDG domain-containing protein [Dysgonamonadaceae bacterium]